MTRKNLEKVYFLKKELEMWQERLTELQADIALGTKVLDGMPRSGTNGINKPTEDKAIKLTETSKIIEGKMSEIQYTVNEIENYILSLEDSLLRTIIYYRCCKLYKWEEVAEKVGAGYNAESVRQIYHRHVKEMPE